MHFKGIVLLGDIQGHFFAVWALNLQVTEFEVNGGVVPYSMRKNGNKKQNMLGKCQNNKDHDALDYVEHRTAS